MDSDALKISWIFLALGGGIAVVITLLAAEAMMAQATPKSIALTDKSNVSSEGILKSLGKQCGNITITTGQGESDYTLEAVNRRPRAGIGIVHENEFDFTLFDRDGNVVWSASDQSLKHTVRALCRAMETAVVVEVVDVQNLTLSSDKRSIFATTVDKTTVGTITTKTSDRKTKSGSIYVIVNGEHALLDCYEQASGCGTVGPGKYYGEKEGDGVWLNYRMPITHKPMRDHYKIAGSW